MINDFENSSLSAQSKEVLLEALTKVEILCLNKTAKLGIFLQWHSFIFVLKVEKRFEILRCWSTEVWRRLRKIIKQEFLFTDNLEKNIWNKAKLDRNRKRWYQHLREFWLLLPMLCFQRGGWVLSSTKFWEL